MKPGPATSSVAFPREIGGGDHLRRPRRAACGRVAWPGPAHRWPGRRHDHSVAPPDRPDRSSPATLANAGASNSATMTSGSAMKDRSYRVLDSFDMLELWSRPRPRWPSYGRLRRLSRARAAERSSLSSLASRPRSSGDRASVSETVCRMFESCRGRFLSSPRRSAPAAAPAELRLPRGRGVLRRRPRRRWVRRRARRECRCVAAAALPLVVNTT